MSLRWTTDELLVAIRELGRIPDADPNATDAKLLAEANRQLSRVFVPAVRKARSDYYITHEDQALVAKQQEYPVPSRSVGSSVRAVLWVDSAKRKHELPPVPLTELYSYSETAGWPTRYTIRDDRIVLLPAPASALGTLRLVFEYRPSELVLVTNASSVAGVSVTGGSYAFTKSDGAGFAGAYSSPTTQRLDVIGGTPPFSTRIYNALMSAVTFLIVPDTNTNVPVVGDWICFTGQTVIPQIPAELHALLALRTAAQYLLPIDPTFAAVLKADFDQDFAGQISLLVPRQIGRQMKMKSSNSLMRRSSRRGRGSFGDWTP